MQGTTSVRGVLSPMARLRQRDSQAPSLGRKRAPSPASRGRSSRARPLAFGAFAIQAKGGRRVRLQTRPCKQQAKQEQEQQQQDDDHGSTLAWETPPRADFPQELLLNFAPSYVQEIRILCHPAKTPSSAVLLIGEAGAEAQRLGRIEFTNGIASGFTKSEVKCISIQRTCSFVHLVIEGCFVNAQNPDMQAKLSAVVVMGTRLHHVSEAEPCAETIPTPRPRSSRVQSALQNLRTVLNANARHVDRQHREQAEHMRQRLEGLEAAKERAVAAEDFARAAELKVSLETLAGRALAQLEAAQKSRANSEDAVHSARSAGSAASFRAAQDAARALIFGPREPDPFLTEPERRRQADPQRRADDASGSRIEPQFDPGHGGAGDLRALQDAQGPHVLQSTAKRIRPKVRMPAALVKGGIRMGKGERLAAKQEAARDPAKSQSLDEVRGALAIADMPSRPQGPLDEGKLPDAPQNNHDQVEDPEQAKRDDRDGSALVSARADRAASIAFPIEQWDLALSLVKRQGSDDAQEAANWSRRSMSDRSELSAVSTDELRDVEAAAPIAHVPQDPAFDGLDTLASTLASSRTAGSPRDQLEIQLKRVIEESIGVDDWDTAVQEYAVLARRGLASGRPKTVTLGLDLLEVVALRFAELSAAKVLSHSDDILALFISCTDMLRDEDADGLLHARIARSLQTLTGSSAESASTVISVLKTGTAHEQWRADGTASAPVLSEETQILLAHRLEVLCIFVGAVAPANAHVATDAMNFVDAVPLRGAAEATKLAVRSAQQRLSAQDAEPTSPRSRGADEGDSSASSDTSAAPHARDAETSETKTATSA